jgi:hypothetical protein
MDVAQEVVADTPVHEPALFSEASTHSSESSSVSRRPRLAALTVAVAILASDDHDARRRRTASRSLFDPSTTEGSIR